MPAFRKEYGPEIQHVPNDTPLEDIILLLKRDGAVFINKLIPLEDVDQACEDAQERIENDLDWDGAFFPSRNPLDEVCEFSSPPSH